MKNITGEQVLHAELKRHHKSRIENCIDQFVSKAKQIMHKLRIILLMMHPDSISNSTIYKVYPFNRLRYPGYTKCKNLTNSVSDESLNIKYQEQLLMITAIIEEQQPTDLPPAEPVTMYRFCLLMQYFIQI